MKNREIKSSRQNNSIVKREVLRRNGISGNSISSMFAKEGINRRASISQFLDMMNDKLVEEKGSGVSWSRVYCGRADKNDRTSIYYRLEAMQEVFRHKMQT